MTKILTITVQLALAALTLAPLTTFHHALALWLGAGLNAAIATRIWRA